MKIVNVLAIVILLSVNSHAQKNPSKLFRDFKKARIEGNTPQLPDFSYAGYHYAEKAIPNQFNLDVFDVTDFGAIPNDMLSDKNAIIKAIAAAEKNKGGIVFFPNGTFLINEKTDITGELIEIKESNIILMGSGSGDGGTILIQNEPTPPESPKKMWTSKYLIQFKHKYKKPEEITKVVKDSDRESFVIHVENASKLKVGQRVSLRLVEKSNPELVASEMAPFEVDSRFKTIINEVHLREIHLITAIKGNQITFKEPIHKEIKSKYNWYLETYDFIEEVGIRDLMYQGRVPLPFNHHAASPNPAAPGWQYDSGWSGVLFSNVVNGWMQNVAFKDMSRSAEFKMSSTCSALHNRYYSSEKVGETAHTFISSNNSNGILNGFNYDLSSGVHHTCGVEAGAIGNVMWYNVGPTNGNSGVEIHGDQPRANLFDACKGGFGFHYGGATFNLPNHLRHLVVWNFEGVGEPNEDFRFYLPESKWKRIIPPIVSGIKGISLSKDPKQVEVNESPGVHVDETSLFESQLNFRLEGLPKWVNQQKSKSSFISPSQLVMIPNETYAINLVHFKRKEKIVWSSTNPNVVSVNENGVVTSHSIGEADIYAVNSKGVKEKATIRVRELVLKVSPEKTTLFVNQTQKIGLLISPSSIKPKSITYKPKKEQIVKVNSEGIITTLKKGKTLVDVIVETNKAVFNTSFDVVVKSFPKKMTEGFDELSEEGWLKNYVLKGENEILWTINAKSVKNSLDSGNNIYFQSNTTGIIAERIMGGIKSFSVECRDLYDTGQPRTLELYINDKMVASKIHYGKDPYVWNVENINVKGDFKMHIRNVSGSNSKCSVAIDNLYWKTNP